MSRAEIFGCECECNCVLGSAIRLSGFPPACFRCAFAVRVPSARLVPVCCAPGPRPKTNFYRPFPRLTFLSLLYIIIHLVTNSNYYYYFIISFDGEHHTLGSAQLISPISSNALKLQVILVRILI